MYTSVVLPSFSQSSYASISLSTSLTPSQFLPRASQTMSTREWHGLESQKKAEQVDWDSNNRKSIITSLDEQNISPPNSQTPYLKTRNEHLCRTYQAINCKPPAYPEPPPTHMRKKSVTFCAKSPTLSWPSRVLHKPSRQP